MSTDNHCERNASQTAMAQLIFWRRWLQAPLYLGLIVAHTGIIRAVIAHVLHSEPMGLYRIKVDNVKFSRILTADRGAMLDRHNCSLFYSSSG